MSTNRFTFWINIGVDIAFALIIVAFALIETFCWSSGTSEPPLSMFFDTSEARFYINNLIIIVCPLIDSIIGIAFSAYNDKIYGFTISDLKNISRYSGFSFFEIISISIISIVLAILFYYLDLFYTALVLNILILLYTIVFVVTDVSLLARSRWRLFGIFKRDYRQNKDHMDFKYLQRFMPNVMIQIKNITQAKYKSGDLTFLNDFGDFIEKFCLQEHGKLTKYEEKFYKKFLKNKSNYRTDSYFWFIVSFSSMLEKVIYESFTDKKVNLSFSGSRKKNLYKIIIDFITFADKAINGESAFANDSAYEYYLVFLESFFDFSEIYELSDFDVNVQILVANMMVKDGIDSTIDYLKISTEGELEICLYFQSSLLDDIVSANQDSIASYLVAAENNLLSCVDTILVQNTLIKNAIQSYSDSFSDSVSSSIIDFKYTTEKFSNDHDSPFELLKLVQKSLPSKTIISASQSDTDKNIVKYHRLVSSKLMNKSLMDENTWVFENYNYLFGNYHQIFRDPDVNFYIFSTIFLYNVYQQQETKEQFRSKIDNNVKEPMLVNMDSYLLDNLENQNAQYLSDLLISLLDIYLDCHGITNWYFESWTYLPPKIYPNFDDKLLILWWLTIVCYLGFKYETNDFSKLKERLNSLYETGSKLHDNNSYWKIFVTMFYQFYDGTHWDYKAQVDMSISYLNYFGKDVDEQKFNDGLNCLKKQVLHCVKNDLLSLPFASPSDINSILVYTRNVIEKDFSKFKLSGDVSGCRKKHSFKKKFSYIVYYDDLNSVFSKRAFCLDFQNKIIKEIFKTIEQDKTINSLGNVRIIKEYEKNELDYINSQHFDEKYISKNIGNGDDKSLEDAIKTLGAETQFQGPFMPNYDLFFHKDAFKVQFSIGDNFKYSALDRQAAIRFIDENYKDCLKDGLYILPIPRSKNKDMYIKFTKDEFIKLITKRCVKLEFSINCVVGFNPKDILVYKR